MTENITELVKNLEDAGSHLDSAQRSLGDALAGMAAADGVSLWDVKAGGEFFAALAPLRMEVNKMTHKLREELERREVSRVLAPAR